MNNVVSAKSNLIVPVPRETVQRWIARLNEHIIAANSITNRSTFADLSRAEINLHKARELFIILRDMNTLANWQAVEEDMNRIESKILDIRGDKLKTVRYMQAKERK